jgi:hypothetical protein
MTRIVVLLSIALAGPAVAKQSMSDLLQGLAQCRSVTGQAEKLACFERETDALIGKSERREVVVATPDEVKLRSAPIPDEIASTIVSAQTTAEGFWRIELAEGGTWRTTEGTSNSRMPRPGLPIQVKRGPVGGYMLSVDKQRSIRAAPVR